ncbi:MAG: cyclic nucleotide-binding domain-containing protein [Bdellovibrionales bacterium]|jgi:CRP/FNR family transcriptional regulator, cyclic AMP receptor protein|nr:cyclic nucleotide-binding domain-containing protein [Bdellovibrionales bacterium]MBT3527117.1 cyclic nucleotide-binding domain-containing protein [Bdellovibrionales bacterium]MBT7670325.1 cyclic nucleotide-binding domain-containing protein [Bdellovibrionales bacterium]MBT7766584.1 cyclic nucleotide-binding domain-containing protein [Bdellovibrionales bacterium]
MNSYEADIKKNREEHRALPRKVELSMLKYFWQASPLGGSRKVTIPKFLRGIDVLSGFTDNELRILTKFLHHRRFTDNEMVFAQGDMGIGFYFVYSGQLNILIKNKKAGNEERSTLNILLEQGDYFGELALLQQNSIRSATVVAQNSAQLLGIFKPDMDELISRHPVVATKLLQSVSMIIAHRLFSLTEEMSRLQTKILQLEHERDNTKVIREK